MLRVPTPVNVLDAPLGEQAINLALSVKSLQLRSLVRQVRVITVNLQDVASREFLLKRFAKKKKGLGELPFARINYTLEYDNSEKTIAPLYKG
jgi:hypothetical protein